MRTALTIGLILMLGACTTLHPIEDAPLQLQARISSGELVKAGDRVQVVTADGQRHKFRVTSVSTDRIEGKHIDLLISDIVTLETRKFSGVRTAALAGGGYLILSLLAVVAAAATVGL